MEEETEVTLSAYLHQNDQEGIIVGLSSSEYYFFSFQSILSEEDLVAQKWAASSIQVADARKSSTNYVANLFKNLNIQEQEPGKIFEEAEEAEASES